MILYSRLDNKKTYCEFWGASTKHPDSINCMNDDIENKHFITTQFVDDICIADVLQWLTYIASQKSWIFHTIEVLEDIQEIYHFCKSNKVDMYA